MLISADKPTVNVADLKQLCKGLQVLSQNSVAMIVEGVSHFLRVIEPHNVAGSVLILVFKFTRNCKLEADFDRCQAYTYDVAH